MFRLSYYEFKIHIISQATFGSDNNMFGSVQLHIVFACNISNCFRLIFDLNNFRALSYWFSDYLQI